MNQPVKKRAYVFLFDGFSDWEIAYLTPEINKSKACELLYFSAQGQTVHSMGGMKVVPDIALEQMNTNEVDLLILPGGTAWEKGENNVLDQLVRLLFEQGKTIAAICAASAYLGQKGFLDRLQHTSNDLQYLKGVAPQYLGEKNYLNTLAVADQNIVTANGIAPIEFAREVFKKLNLYSDVETEQWYQLFKNGVWQE
ncbi:type 1 glutamine amidotransferase family protein [Microscilla marina]|uniref:ThiJ/PfpI family protein n=1 Tax=Microscilla marina ATCC 23134 TaxID=313606 RepID=A1ZE60_MICM2|nr:type 1 glutamine amidotransferase family protein [Microscilla marina]EAY31368.1 ThiJ/PfpI family protein [Microscilla marina ATCC 23134]